MKDTLTMVLVWIVMIAGFVTAAAVFLALRVLLSHLLWVGILLILAYNFLI